MENLENLMRVLRAWLRTLGPYVLLEILLPGGTLVALLLLLYRSGRLRTGGPRAAALAPYAMHAIVSRRQGYVIA